MMSVLIFPAPQTCEACPLAHEFHDVLKCMRTGDMENSDCSVPVTCPLYMLSDRDADLLARLLSHEGI